MPTLKGLKGAVLLLGAAVWGTFPPSVALAQQQPLEEAIVAAGGSGSACLSGTPAIRPDSLEQLARLSWQELEQLYRQSEPGTLPVGYVRGRAIYCPEAFLTATRSRVTRLLWHGKHFCAGDSTLINQWCGFKAIRAAVSYGPSWLDGSPAIIMDYGDTSRVWADVRDEVREVAPGLYLGMMFLRREPQAKLKMFFALSCQPPQAGQPH